MDKEVIVVTGITFKRALATSYEDFMTFQTMNIPTLTEIESERCDAFLRMLDQTHLWCRHITLPYSK